jgi:hypothetical protein
MIGIYKITEDEYYIQKPLIEFTESELITEDEVAELKKLNDQLKEERANNKKF